MSDLNNRPLPEPYITPETHNEVLRRVLGGDPYEQYRHWIASGHTIDMFEDQIKALEKQLEGFKKDG